MPFHRINQIFRNRNVETSCLFHKIVALFNIQSGLLIQKLKTSSKIVNYFWHVLAALSVTAAQILTTDLNVTPIVYYTYFPLIKQDSVGESCGLSNLFKIATLVSSS